MVSCPASGADAGAKSRIGSWRSWPPYTAPAQASHRSPPAIIVCPQPGQVLISESLMPAA